MDFKVVRNDITDMEVDTIVLPANTRLRVGRGASMAIFNKAGQNELEKACRQIYEDYQGRHVELEPGMTVATPAFALPSKVILHTIVPRWRDGAHGEYGQLSKAYLSALSLADSMGFKSIAFPLLASGNNGFDTDVAIEVAVASIKAYQQTDRLSEVFIVVFEASAAKKMRDLGYDVQEYIDQLYVLEQGFAQGAERDSRIEHRKKKKVDKGSLDRALRKAKKWVSDPKNQKILNDLAHQAIKLVYENTKEEQPQIALLLKPFIQEEE